jgi:4-nitrophenyl phosphatase
MLRGFLIDLDGTLYAGRNPIPYAYEFIALLQHKKLPFLLLTNNSSRMPEEVTAHLYEVSGIQAAAQHIYTSAQAAAQYIVDQQGHKTVYCIGEKGLIRTLEEADLKVMTSDGETGHLAFKPDQPPPKYVVQGIDRQFTYEKLKHAVQFIAQGAAFINTNPDHLLPSEGGLQPGAGAIAAAIEAASQVKPIVIGKPSSIIMHYAIQRLNLAPSEIWVIGDNIRTDIGGGKLAGCRTALVLTGLATSENVQEQIQASGIHPDLVCAHLMALAEELDI